MSLSCILIFSSELWTSARVLEAAIHYIIERFRGMIIKKKTFGYRNGKRIDFICQVLLFPSPELEMNFSHLKGCINHIMPERDSKVMESFSGIILLIEVSNRYQKHKILCRRYCWYMNYHNSDWHVKVQIAVCLVFLGS